MKTNPLKILFEKLIISQYSNWTRKSNLRFRFSVKSYYKNDEIRIVNLLNKINKKILSNLSKSLSESLYLYKILSFLLIKRNLNNKNLSYKYSNSLDYINDNYYLSKKEINYKNYISNDLLLFSLIQFYFLSFVFLFSLKFQLKDTVQNTKLPNRSSKITLLRSPHIDKKSREQFEVVTHKSVINLVNFVGNDIKNLIVKESDSSYIEFFDIK